MTASYEQSLDFIRGITVDAASTPQVFTLAGGLYALTAYAAAWGGGNADLQLTLPDLATYGTALAAPFTANGLKVVDLPAGQYKFVITTTNGVYFTVSRIRRERGG